MAIFFFFSNRFCFLYDFMIFVLFSLFYLILGQPTQPNPDCICHKTQTECQCDSHWVSPSPGIFSFIQHILPTVWSSTAPPVLQTKLNSVKFASFVRRGPRETKWLRGGRTGSPWWRWRGTWWRGATWSARDWRLPVSLQSVLLQCPPVTSQ